MQSAETLENLQKFLKLLDPSKSRADMLTNVARQLVEMFDVDHSGVMFFSATDTEGEVVAEYPPQGVVGLRASLLNYPLVDQLKIERKPIAIFDAQEDSFAGGMRDTFRAIGIKSIAIIPLVVKDKLIGGLGLDVIREKRVFTPAELELGGIIGTQIAVAIDYMEALEAERVARVQADTLREVAAILNETLDLNQVLEPILDQIGRVVSCDSSSIILRDEDKLRVVATRGFPNPQEIIGLTFNFQEQAPYQEIARTRRPLILQDTLEAAGWQDTGPRPIRSWIGAPLLVSDRLIGLLTVDHSQPNFYHQSDGEVVIAFANMAAIALENARLYQFEVKQIEQELSIARQIQRGFLPQRIPEIPGWQIAAVCLPARETGGDFYEFVERTDGALGLAVGDVSGKSVPAAMLMAAAQSMVGAKGSDHRSPAKVMSEVNMLLCDDIPRGTFVAMSYALLTPNEPTVYLSNGGQLAPFLVPAGERPIQLVETPTPRWPMGILPDSCYQETAITLEPGDLLVFCTDGLVERKNEGDELFGFERVGSVLDELRGQSPDYVLQRLLAVADSFAQGLSAHDDVTLLVVQRVPYINN